MEFSNNLYNSSRTGMVKLSEIKYYQDEGLNSCDKFKRNFNFDNEMENQAKKNFTDESFSSIEK
jgi:hypothetical protein